MRARTGREPQKPARGGHRKKGKGEAPARGAQVEQAVASRAAAGSGEISISAVAESDDPLLAESGLPLNPEDLGVRFLRDATGQDNFESRVMLADTREHELDEEDLAAPALSGAAIDAALEEDLELSETDAFIDASTQNSNEPSEQDIDLTGDSIHLASLFDQPVPDDALEESANEGETMQPALHTEDPSEFAEAREREIRRRRDELLAKRRRTEGVTQSKGKDKS